MKPPLNHDVLVLYIGGTGRSGSTVLAEMLGRDGVMFPVGELRGVWQAMTTNELCGCGSRFSECEFWGAVGNSAFGGWNQIDVKTMLHFDNDYARHRFVARLAVPAIRLKHAGRLDEYTTVLRSLYSSIREVSGCEVIVDSTKDPPYAFLLREVPGLQLRVVHLVRDSRGVAFSWAKEHVPRPEYVNHPALKQTFMNRQQPWRSALEWDAKNALFHVLGRSGVPRVLMRYESLVAAPETEIQRVLSLLGCPPPHDREGPRSRQSHHTLGGNRVRFEPGPVRIRGDYEWQRSMRPSQRVIVGALTLPFLLAYGYIKPRGPIAGADA